MLFQSDKNILVIAINQTVAKNLVTKVREMYTALPKWLKVDADEDNKLSLRFKNGSQIKAVGATESAGRSEALSLLIIDEAAFIRESLISEIWTSAQQTLATGGGAIVLSTPNGVGNWFHKTWIDSEAGENSFNTIRLKWDMHPERDQSWRDKQTELLGIDMAAQECLGKDTMVTVRNDLTGDYIRYIVRHGLMSMPAFVPTDISERQMDELIKYLTQHSASMGK